MTPEKLQALLEGVASGALSPDDAVHKLRGLPFEDLGFAKIDHHRPLRKGYPETIWCAGKTPEQIVRITAAMRDHGSNVLGTRCSSEGARAVLEAFPEAHWHEQARCITLLVDPPAELPGYVAVVCAGTTDIPVAEEAAITLALLGCRVERVYDVGVAGIHRLFERRPVLQDATALVVCAGMEGALPSVVGGLVHAPVIAVPTSVGYGASFGGLAALLGMLNSCATGLTVVNIDNGFGAGIAAGTIHRMVQQAALGAAKETK